MSITVTDIAAIKLNQNLNGSLQCVYSIDDRDLVVSAIESDSVECELPVVTEVTRAYLGVIL